MKKNYIIFTLLISMVCGMLFVACQKPAEAFDEKIVKLQETIKDLQKADIVPKKVIKEVNQLLDEAKSLGEQGKYREALDLLKEASKILAKEVISGVITDIKKR